MNPLFQLCVCVRVCEHVCGRRIYWVWVSLLPPLMPCDCHHHHHHQSWHLVSSLQLTKIACIHSPSFGPHENLGWGQDILLYYNLLIEERLRSSTLPSLLRGKTFTWDWEGCWDQRWSPEERTRFPSPMQGRCWRRLVCGERLVGLLWGELGEHGLLSGCCTAP